MPGTAPAGARPQPVERQPPVGTTAAGALVLALGLLALAQAAALAVRLPGDGDARPPAALRPDAAVEGSRVVSPRRAPGRVVVPDLALEGPAAPGGAALRYRLRVAPGLGVDERAFAAQVQAILADPRSWARGAPVVRVTDPADIADVEVVLAGPALTDRLCVPLDTAGRYSCGLHGRAVLNARRWLEGAPAYAGDLAGYRAYLVNHEVGHVLGHGHRGCPRPGALAPVMLQQTKGLRGCARNSWPYP